MSAAVARHALNDWAMEREAARKGLEFNYWILLIAELADDGDMERLAELFEFHASEEALG